LSALHGGLDGRRRLGFGNRHQLDGSRIASGAGARRGDALADGIKIFG